MLRTKLWHIVSKLTNVVVFNDPLNNEVTGTLCSLVDIAIRKIFSASEDHEIVLEGRHHVMHIRTQPNGWDCGFHIMKTIQMLVEEFILGWISLEFCNCDCKWMSHVDFVNCARICI